MSFFLFVGNVFGILTPFINFLFLSFTLAFLKLPYSQQRVFAVQVFELHRLIKVSLRQINNFFGLMLMGRLTYGWF